MAWLSFIDLDKTVVHVIRLATVCDCGFSLSALSSPVSVPTVLLGFLLPWMWGLSSQLLQLRAAAAPYFGFGVAPLSRTRVLCSRQGQYEKAKR